MDKIIMESKINQNAKLAFWLKNIPLSAFENTGDYFNLKYQDLNYHLSLKLGEKLYNFIRDLRLNVTKKKQVQNNFVIVKKNDTSLLDVGIKVDPQLVINHNYSLSKLVINNSDEDLTIYEIQFNKEPITLITAIKAAQRKMKKKEKRKAQKVKDKEERKKSTSELVKKFEELQRKHVSGYEFETNNLSEKGIYLAHPNAYKRCENCVNYSGSKCTSFNLEVSDNHKCSRFYSFKTYYGGGFSPR
jgi:hypothetical protein